MKGGQKQDILMNVGIYKSSYSLTAQGQIASCPFSNPLNGVRLTGDWSISLDFIRIELRRNPS